MGFKALAILITISVFALIGIAAVWNSACTTLCALSMSTTCNDITLSKTCQAMYNIIQFVGYVLCLLVVVTIAYWVVRIPKKFKSKK